MVDEGLTVEVGPRTIPFVGELRKDLLSGNRIVYFEKRSGWIKELSGGLKDEETAVQGDGSRLSLPSKSVGAIFAKDLFGAHGKFAYLPEQKADFTRKEDIGKGLAKEWFRVCQSAGRVIILETATPADFNTLDNEFSQAGFEKVEEYRGEDLGKIFQEADLWKNLAWVFAKDSYSVVYKKP